jgi:hypothetical protein
MMLRWMLCLDRQLGLYIHSPTIVYNPSIEVENRTEKKLSSIGRSTAAASYLSMVAILDIEIGSNPIRSDPIRDTVDASVLSFDVYC